MDGGTWSTVLGTFRKAPSLVGANVVTYIKIDCAAQGSRTIKPTKLEAFRDGYMSNVRR
jgi:hypothetical protein